METCKKQRKPPRNDSKIKGDQDMGLNVELLESSFKLVAPKGEALVTRFYERLFKKYPAVKPLFKKTSIKEQKKKLLASLVLVIQNLRHPDKLTPVLQDMGARHVGYGAKPAHYDAVGENLLAVLGEVAGSAWTPQVKQAWTDAYGAIKTIMLAGAERAHSTQGDKTMSKAKQKKGAAAGTDMMGFYLGALDQSQNNILLCDRNLVITYANSTAKKTLISLEAEIKKVLPAEKALHAFMKSKYAELTNRIEDTKDLSKDDEAALTAAMKDFKANGSF